MDALASFDIEAVEGKIEREGQEMKERTKKKCNNAEKRNIHIYTYICVCMC